MPSHPQNGRNVALPDENRPSWRPQDEIGHRNRTPMYDEEEEDRRMRSRGPWEDYPGAFEERYRERHGGDDRFYGRDGYAPERYGAQGGYGGGRGWEPERVGMQRGYDHNLGTGGREHTGYSQGGYQGPGMMHGTRTGGHRGKGPASYQRSDERIRELVCEALTEDDRVDATNVEVQVSDGEVTLTGMVDDRHQKRCAEDCIEQVMGVKDVQNQLRCAGQKKPDEPRHR